MMKTQVVNNYRRIAHGGICVQFIQTKMFCISIVTYGLWTAVRCVRIKGEVWECGSRHALKVRHRTCRPKTRGERRGESCISIARRHWRQVEWGGRRWPEPFETNGINKVLDFEDTGENVTLSTVDETEGPSMSRGRGSQCEGETKYAGTESNPTYNPTSEEQSAEEEFEETSFMEHEGGFHKP